MCPILVISLCVSSFVIPSTFFLRFDTICAFSFSCSVVRGIFFLFSFDLFWREIGGFCRLLDTCDSWKLLFLGIFGIFFLFASPSKIFRFSFLFIFLGLLFSFDSFCLGLFSFRRLGIRLSFLSLRSFLFPSFW